MGAGGRVVCFVANTAFPWRHDTIGTAEDLAIFFGNLWVLC